MACRRFALPFPFEYADTDYQASNEFVFKILPEVCGEIGSWFEVRSVWCATVLGAQHVLLALWFFWDYKD